MALLHRRESPPAALRALVGRDDRILSWADAEDGGVVAASRLGLWWPQEGSARLIGWQFVDKAVWREGVLTVIQADVADDLLLVDRPAVAVRLRRPRDLPATVRRRVESNVVRSELRTLPGGSGRFVARRVPGRDGAQWWVRLEPGTPDTAEVRADAAAQRTQLQELWAAAR